MISSLLKGLVMSLVVRHVGKALMYRWSMDKILRGSYSTSVGTISSGVQTVGKDERRSTLYSNINPKDKESSHLCGC
jgi:hypothetical protein